MKALVHTATLKLEYIEWPAPILAPLEVLVRVAAVAICGSDVHGYTGTTGRRIPPIIMGHEASGVVEAVGAQVSGWPPGTRVTFDSTVYCNECSECRRGRINLCENRQILGVSPPAFRRHGAMAEFVAVPHWILHRLPDRLSFEEAALVEPAAVAMHAARITPIAPGATVVVVGAGAIGLLALQAAKLLGAGMVVVLDVREERLAVARQLGADVVINSGSGDPREELRAVTGRPTADVVMEAVGIGLTVQLATDLSAPGGNLTLIGNVQPSIEQNLQAIISKELTIRGSAASAGEYPTCLAFLAAGRLHVKPIISRVMSLADGQAAFDALRRGDAGLLKIVLRPEAGAGSREVRMSDAFDLTGRVALVTGGSRGLGRGFAAALAGRGANVAITSRTIESLADTQRELESFGVDVFPCTVDTAKVETIGPMVDLVMERFGQIDILVNNAGSNVRKPAVDMLPADWDGVVNTILRGTFFVSTAVVRSAMSVQHYGRIINLGSGTSVFGMPGIAPYCAARGGMTQLTKALAAEWAADGITVNAIAPGWFKTAQNAILYEDPEWVAGVVARIPAGRTGEHGDLDGAVIFLASEAASYVTGQLLFVDGGFSTGAMSAMPRRPAAPKG